MPFKFRKSVHQFSGYEQKAFSRLNRKYIFSDNIFLSSLLQNLIIYRLKFEILSNSSQVMSQKPVFEGHFRFSWPNRKQIFSDNIFLSSLLSNLIIYRLNSEILSNRSQVMSQKPVSEGHFRISWPNRKQISKTKGGVPYSRTNLNLCRLNFENRSISFRAIREQHTDCQIHTYHNKQLFKLYANVNMQVYYGR